jgi:mannose-6-phosphate isomerase-like protein (cupin superfamily)
MERINLAKKFSMIKTHWDPKIVGELNDQFIKLVKFKGAFTWHKHQNEDEMFLVVRGSFEMQFRDKSIFLNRGEFIIVPRGIEHCPKAEKEVHILLFEPKTTINTGDQVSDKTVLNPEFI